MNHITRGCIYAPAVKELSTIAQQIFGLTEAMTILSAADLYGSKICAALDRQHPRDLFDIKLLFENQGLTEEIRKAKRYNNYKETRIHE